MTSNQQSKEFVPTDEQRAVIQTPGSLIVSASAGSGKTSVMIRRIIRLIDDGAQLGQFLVSTFTRAAAQDIRYKLACALGDRADAPEQLGQLTVADIGTFHSICMRLLRTYFYVLGIDPNFEVIDEFAAGVMLRRAVSDVIDSAIWLASHDGDTVHPGQALQPIPGLVSEDMLLLYDAFVPHRSTAHLCDIVRELYEFARAQTSMSEWLDNADQLYRDEHQEQLRQALCDQEMRRRTDFLMDALAQLDQLECDPDCWEQLKTRIDSLRNSIANNCAPERLTSLTQLSDQRAALYERFKQINTSVREAKCFVEFQPEFAPADICRRHIHQLVALVRRIDVVFGERKSRASKLDYPDLERLMLELLADSETLALLRAKYKYVFVDEYQDTNPLQDAILNLLIGQNECFFVGDIKQSIYGFRMCDPRFFAQRMASFPPDRVITLSRNFRSDPQILQFVNDVFASQMTIERGGVDYASTSMLRPRDGASPSPDALVIKRLSPPPKQPPQNWEPYDIQATPTPKLPAFDAEVNAICEHAHDLVTRGVPQGDIVILLRSNTGFAKLLAERLRMLDLTVARATKDDLCDLPEIVPIFAFLQILDNPNNDIALATVLRSVIGGFDDADLLQIRANFPPPPPGKPSSDQRLRTFSEAVSAYRQNIHDQLSQRLEGFYQRYARLRDCADAFSVAEVVGKLVSGCRYFQHLFAQPDGAQMASNLHAYIQQLTTHPYGASVGDYVYYIENNQATAPAPSDEVQPDCIRIMTIHASKGLEFPYVILGGLSQRINYTDAYQRLLRDSQRGLAICFDDPFSGLPVSNAAYCHLSNQIRASNLSEEMRLLYVASTRAVRQLALFCTAVHSSDQSDDDSDEVPEPGVADVKNYQDILLPTIERWDCIELDHADYVQARMSNASPVRYTLVDPVVTELIREAIDNPRCAYALTPVKSSVTRMVETLDDQESAKLPLQEAPVEYIDNERAAQRGVLMHRAMELIDFDTSVETALAGLDAVLELDDLARSQIAAAHRTINKLRANSRIYREKAFVLNTTARALGFDSDNQLLVQGIIDLLLIDQDGRATIIDYKTSVHTAPTSAQRSQLDFYRLAVTQILGLEVKSTAIYYFRNDSLVQI